MQRQIHQKRFVLSRILYTLLFIAIQLALLVVMFWIFWDKFPYFYGLCVLLSILSVTLVINSSSNPAYKIAWLIPLLLLPVFGGLLYLMFARHRPSKKRQAAFTKMLSRSRGILARDSQLAALEDADPEAALHAHYIQHAAGSPPFCRTETRYFPLGESLYASLLEELARAEHTIFLEYFIIEEGVMWNSILDILEKKAAAGVDVRVLYDDLGCIFTLPRNYFKRLRQKGIQAQVFNPFNTILSPRFNNRDHRKICVIDGFTAFTGGINLADEYINAYAKHGHWKDTGILLRGGAAWSLTVQFLTLWDLCQGTQEDFSSFRPNRELWAALPENGFVQPYSDIPQDEEQVGETVYLNLINRARRYVYITTPYLILDNELMTALQTAAKSGVDVRILTPHIPDKKLVFFLTRSYYQPLLDAGVGIWEYTPGFLHAKTMVSDDRFAVVGTINLDYRSLYLHLECAAWMYNCSAVEDVYRDFLETQACSQPVTAKEIGRQFTGKGLLLSFLRTFAPLL